MDQRIIFYSYQKKSLDPWPNWPIAGLCRLCKSGLNWWRNPFVKNDFKLALNIYLLFINVCANVCAFSMWSRLVSGLYSDSAVPIFFDQIKLVYYSFIWEASDDSGWMKKYRNVQSRNG